MFDKPEELILAIITVLWVILTYFIGGHLGTPWVTKLFITALSALWASAVFILWQKNKIKWIWPICLGLLMMCWWPYFDSLAISQINPTQAGETVLILKSPWYTRWTFKLVIAVIPVVIGYGYIWRKHHQAKNQSRHD